MDRQKLKLPFTLDFPKNWICPTCQTGSLWIKRETFHKGETRISKNYHSHEDWNPVDIEYAFSCMLVCKNDLCKETVSCAGVGGVEEEFFDDEDGDVHHSFEDYFLPTYFTPHLRLIQIPAGCPKSVSAPLNESFKLFFCSPRAALNNVRMAVEELLTELKVRRFNIVNKERRFISLHQRIDLLPGQHAHLKEFLVAIKWLGNAGSHANGGITADDVMDSYEMVAHVLEHIYVPKPKKLEEAVGK